MGACTPKDKDFEMKRFASNESQILVATTVIEVGVNVPNATVMVIENAERLVSLSCINYGEGLDAVVQNPIVFC